MKLIIALCFLAVVVAALPPRAVDTKDTLQADVLRVQRYAPVEGSYIPEPVVRIPKPKGPDADLNEGYTDDVQEGPGGAIPEELVAILG